LRGFEAALCRPGLDRFEFRIVLGGIACLGKRFDDVGAFETRRRRG
jgi:hypothetical protein